MSKKLLFFALLANLLVLVSCVQQPLNIVHNGDIELGLHTDNNRINFNLKLVNSGSKPIIIDSITTSVSYLKPTIAVNQDIQLGDTLEIPMSLFTQSLSGDVVAQLRVFYSSSNRPLEKLIRATIQPTPTDISQLCTVPFGPLFIDRNLVSMPDLLVGKQMKDSILIYNPTDRAVNIVLPREYGNASATMSSTIINPGKADYIVISSKYDDFDKIGERIFHTFRFNFGREIVSNAYIYLQGELSEDFSTLTAKERKNAPRAEVSERTYDFGNIKEGQEITHTFTLTNKGKRVLKIRSASSSCDCTLLKLKTDSLMPGDSMPLTLFFNSKGKYGTQQREIKMKTNDPENSLIELWLTGNVE